MTTRLQRIRELLLTGLDRAIAAGEFGPEGLGAEQPDVVDKPSSLVIYTPEEAAAVLKVPPKTVTALCAQGRIPGAAKVGRRWRIPATAIVDYFEAARKAAAPPAPEPSEKTREQLLDIFQPLQSGKPRQPRPRRARPMPVVEKPKRPVHWSRKKR